MRASRALIAGIAVSLALARRVAARRRARGGCRGARDDGLRGPRSRGGRRRRVRDARRTGAGVRRCRGSCPGTPVSPCLRPVEGSRSRARAPGTARCTPRHRHRRGRAPDVDTGPRGRGARVVARRLAARLGERDGVGSRPPGDPVDRNGFRRLTNGPADDREPAWSPDGRTVAFASNEQGGTFDLCPSSAAAGRASAADAPGRHAHRTGTPRAPASHTPASSARRRTSGWRRSTGPPRGCRLGRRTTGGPTGRRTDGGSGSCAAAADAATVVGRAADAARPHRARAAARTS